MFADDGRLVLSATDLTRHLGCAHATTLELARVRGEIEAPQVEDLQAQLVTNLGTAHETAYLEQLRSEGRRVVEVDRGGTLAERELATVEAIRSGADVVYQATLFDGHWLGYADFLVRAERPSDLGAWSYDVVDTKLSRHLSVAALLQMAGYGDRLATLQGAPPRWLTVVGGDGQERTVPFADVESYARRQRRGLVRFLTDGADAESVPTAHCTMCRWLPRCTAGWQDRDDLCLVAGMRADQRRALMDVGITTVAGLAAADPSRLRGVLTERTRERLHDQARLQVQERETGETAYLLLPPESGRGLQLLPEPDDGDVHLDFEGDPFADDGRGREYLAGVWTRDGQFHDWWAHSWQEEGRLTGELLSWLHARWEQHPGMHVYHYADYEVSALKRLAQQHAVGESELDRLLRGGRFVDLYQVVRQGVRISKGSYSIKKVEDFYWGRTRTGGEDEVTDAMASVVEYERWLAGGRTEQAILDAIRAYNREDVRSTHDLHAWLEGLRDELGDDHELDRPAPKEQEEARDGERAREEEALADRLVEHGDELLAGLVGWHRREDKHAWWDYFRTETMSEHELVEDAATIGALGPPVEVGTVKKSTVWEYRFPPQDTSVRKVGEAVDDARTHQAAGTLVGIDPEAGWIRLRIATGRPPATPSALVQKEIVPSGQLRNSLVRLAEDRLAGRDVLGLRLLAAHTPAIPRPLPGEGAGELMRRVGRALDGEVLAVQGPPGAGKSYNGALLIAELLDAGKKVGVTAQSHRVIADLMDKVDRPGVRKGRVAEDEAAVRVVTGNKDVDEALADEVRFVGGTAWLWARPEMQAAVDVLVVDEAGQFSLANAAAVAQGARSLVLLGDPQQLRSPTQADHPYGAGVSALEHLLDGRDTIDPARGVFLDRTWRMHPAITSFISGLAYEDRLESQDGMAQQAVSGTSRLDGSGLRWLPVEHEGNGSSSPEEVEAVAGLVAELLAGSWTDQDGVTRPLGGEDVLVVAPYNAHVAALREGLPEDVPVGTVDKFQGHEGAVVVYAMGASSAKDAPRGVPFLFDVHRLNVAVSRARALAVVVGSPVLLEAGVSTPEQLRAVNALCRFVEEADALS